MIGYGTDGRRERPLRRPRRDSRWDRGHQRSLPPPAEGRFQVATVCGLPLAHFAARAKAGEAHAMVCLVDLGWAQQTEVARALGCDVRTVRRHQRRFEEGGLCALGRPRGFPRGRPRVREDAVNGWQAEGVSNREIARRLGINEKAVRKLVKRLGWKERSAEQMTMPFEGADPKLSASATDQDRAPLSMGLDPADRAGDRLLARPGLLNDAAPVFGAAVPPEKSIRTIRGRLLALPPGRSSASEVKVDTGQKADLHVGKAARLYWKIRRSGCERLPIIPVVQATDSWHRE